MNALLQRLGSFDWQATTALVLSWIGLAILYGSLLALLTWVLVKTAFRRAWPALHGALWLIVLLKFILPIGPAWSFSLSSLFTGATRWLPTSALPVAAPADRTIADKRLLLIPVDAREAAATTTVAAPANRFWNWTTVLATAYLFGLAVVAFWRIRAYRQFIARCRRLPKASDSLGLLVADVCRRLDVRRVPVTRLSDEAAAPFLFGVFHPTLVLSRRPLDRPDELEAVVLHEIAHLRRGDLLVRHLQWLAGTLLFFWPVVAWVNRRLDLAREHACDAYALRHGRLSAGDYARTLLKAAQSGRGRWQAYRPNAMAANLNHVERRIEMILNATPRRNSRRMLGLAGAGIALGWAGFVLTGAGAAQDKPAAPQETQDAQIEIVEMEGVPQEGVFILQGADAGEDAVHFNIKLDGGAHGFADVLFGAPPGGVMFFESEECDGDGAEPRRVLLHSVGGLPTKALAAFLEQHPSADANADGQLTNVEREAYLVALAMSDPAAVLAKYPKADRNGNGKLEALEAARLVQDGGMEDHLKLHKPMPARVRTSDAADGQAKVEKDVRVLRFTGTAQEAQAAEAPVQVRVAAPEGGVAVAGVPLEVRVAAPEGQTATADGAPQRLMLRRHAAGAAQRRPEPAFAWLPKNITATPAAADVARYIPVVEEAPLATFLEMNPKADANGDGKLTAAERDAYLERHMSEMRKRVLETHPEVDANGDGLLSDEEMRSFKTQLPAKGRWLGAMHGGAPQEVVGQHLILRAEGPNAEGNVEVKVAPQPSNNEPR